MKQTILAFVILVTTNVLMGQGSPQKGLTSQPNQTDSALTAQTRHVFEAISLNTLKTAREMPEKSYGFRPVDGARTFGELVEHIADVQATLCADINGHHAAKSGAKEGSKESLVKDLESSGAECSSAFGELSAENASKLVEAPAGKVTHLAALIYIITHASEEYGQMSVYLRLNHMSPQTSDEAKEGSAGKAKS